ncbi:MAG: hypothetical protein CME62_12160 [Halobacteriovoraceae bacterium]|nr:hypothetical protein [Halobacteriovoraceae bacterium]
MKQIITTFLLTLSLASFGQGHVEDFKSEGWFGDTDILDRAEEFLGFGGSCEDATQAEFDYIEEKTPGVFIENSEGIKTTDDFDNWSEELVFSSTAQKVQEQSSCQNKLFQGLARDKDAAKLMEDHAWYQFNLVKDKIKDLLGLQESAQDRLDQVRSNSNYREDRYSARMTNYWQDQDQQKSADLREAKAKVAMAFARLPLGNRVEMREVLTELFDSNSISEYQFRLAYQRGVGILREQARKSIAFFNEIQDENGKHLYYVDEDLKKSLVQSGVVANLVEGLGMEEALKNKFMCRANARYKRGAQALLAAEIPLYFTGMYGLGRAAVAMGAKAVTLGSKAARGAAVAAQYGARGAMLGLDAYAYARIADEVRQVCWKDEYTAAVQAGGSCNFASEVSGVYQEASIGQCATMAALGFGPLAAVTAVRVAKPLNQIVVTGSRTRNLRPTVAPEPTPIPSNTPGIAREIPVARRADIAPEPTPINTIVVSAGNSGKSQFYLTGREFDQLSNSSRVKKVLASDNFQPSIAGKLSDKERIFIVEELSGTGLTHAEATRILRAHQRGRGYGEYSFADIRFKRNELHAVLKGAGHSDSEIAEITAKLMRRGVIGKASNLSKYPKIQAKLKATREAVEGKTFNVGSEFKQSVLNEVPEKLKNGFAKAIDEMSDSKKLADYFEDLQKDTFARMLRSKKKNLNTMAKNGELDKESMIAILKKRAKDNGANVETITQGLSSSEFNKVIGRGMIIDKGFSEGSSHGVYSHFIQQDFSYTIISKTSKVKYDEIIDFMGTPEGMRVWDRMYDGLGTGNPFSPEWFTPNLMRDNIPLGFNFHNKDKNRELVA